MIREAAMQDRDQAISGSEPGRIGEQLRRSEAFRKASVIFVTPALVLRQVRMNILTDNKTLIMPSSHLREGFYILKPMVVPFKHISKAVTPAGLTRFGTKLKAADLHALAVDLVICESLAVDRHGYMVGDGHGFLDLSVAILSAYGAVTEQTMIVTTVLNQQPLIEPLAYDFWDIRAHGILSATGVEMIRPIVKESRPILWEQLTLDRIKRITPLWQLSRAREEEKAVMQQS